LEKALSENVFLEIEYERKEDNLETFEILEREKPTK